MWSITTSLLVLPFLLFALLLVRRVGQSLIPPPKHHGIPRAPYLPDWIPFIGNALNMPKGDSFWSESIRACGPVIRIQALGDTKTFVTTAPLVSYVYKHSKNFDFHWFRKSMQAQIFGIPWSKAFLPIWDDKIFPVHHRNMQPGAIAPMIWRYADILENEIEGRLNASNEKVVDFTDFIFDLIYTASAKAFYHPSFPAAAIKNDFIIFDQAFPILNLSTLPAITRKTGEAARARLLAGLEDWYRTLTKEDKEILAPGLLGMIEATEDEGWSNHEIAVMLFLDLWALEANAPFAAMWTMIQIARKPDLLAILREEILGVQQTLSPPTLSSLLHLPQPTLVARLPTLNACVSETLRYYSDSYSLRIVQEDCVLPPDLCVGGPGETQGLALVKGEQVVCVTRVSAMDEDGEWGTSAPSWDYKRQLEEKKGPMSPFGGGVSMCEGRHFASAEILTMLAAFSMLANAEIVEDAVEPNRQRVGMGIQQPKGKFRVRISKRS